MAGGEICKALAPHGGEYKKRKKTRCVESRAETDGNQAGTGASHCSGDLTTIGRH